MQKKFLKMIFTIFSIGTLKILLSVLNRNRNSLEATFADIRVNINCTCSEFWKIRVEQERNLILNKMVNIFILQTESCYSYNY